VSTYCTSVASWHNWGTTETIICFCWHEAMERYTNFLYPFHCDAKDCKLKVHQKNQNGLRQGFFPKHHQDSLQHSSDPSCFLGNGVTSWGREERRGGEGRGEMNPSINFSISHHRHYSVYGSSLIARRQLSPLRRLCFTRRLSLCLLATSRKNYWSDLMKFYRRRIFGQKKFPLNSGSHPDPESGPDSPRRRSALSKCSYVAYDERRMTCYEWTAELQWTARVGDDQNTEIPLDFYRNWAARKPVL